METVYTLPQLKDLWKDYTEAHCWKVIKAGGKKAIRMTAPDLNAEKMLDCKMKKVAKVMSFPKYLETTKLRN